MTNKCIMHRNDMTSDNRHARFDFVHTVENGVHGTRVTSLQTKHGWCPPTDFGSRMSNGEGFHLTFTDVGGKDGTDIKLDIFDSGRSEEGITHITYRERIKRDQYGDPVVLLSTDGQFLVSQEDEAYFAKNQGARFGALTDQQNQNVQAALRHAEEHADNDKSRKIIAEIAQHVAAFQELAEPTVNKMFANGHDVGGSQTDRRNLSPQIKPL